MRGAMISRKVAMDVEGFEVRRTGGDERITGSILRSLREDW
jgi:hypothetical protein